MNPMYFEGEVKKVRMRPTQVSAGWDEKVTRGGLPPKLKEQLDKHSKTIVVIASWKVVEVMGFFIFT